MAERYPSQGLLRVVSPDDLTAVTDQEDAQKAANDDASKKAQAVTTGLVQHIRTEFDQMRRHRSSAQGWNMRLLDAMRVFNGQYDPMKLAQIKKFGGSEVYARVIAVKCRGASSLLRDVYLGQEKPWGLTPTPDPELPDNVSTAISQLVNVEIGTMQQAGQAPDPTQIRDRVAQLTEQAKKAAVKKARDEAKQAEDKLDDMLVEGKFYQALAEFLVDLPLFPFACMKGPTVRIVPVLSWQDGKMQSGNEPRMFWNRISPFDLYWTPGVSDIEDAAVIERVRYTRADLNDLLGLDGYNEEAIRQVLQLYGAGGLDDNWDDTDSERAEQESRENPSLNRSGLINGLEYHGNVQGSLLLDYGMDETDIPDADRDYFIDAWMISNYIIKVQISPSPRKRVPYYITSFEKVPGTVVGNALPDILADIQDVCNATLRALVNNLSISSGPQVTVNVDRCTPDTNTDELYPWKRWHVNNDPMGNSASVPPIGFFHPDSHAQELLGVYEKFTQIADELSAIPRYTTGSNPGGGAGRTASGLAMLMGNASKILQTVAANVDRDVFEPLLSGLYDMVMLTDESGLLRGDEAIKVQGVNVAIQRETLRARQLEFLTATANPIDVPLMGPKGRAAVLRAVASTIGLTGENVVLPDEDIDQMNKMAAAAAAQAPPMSGEEAAKQAQGGQAPTPNQDMGPRTNLMPRIKGGVG